MYCEGRKVKPTLYFYAISLDFNVLYPTFHRFFGSFRDKGLSLHFHPILHRITDIFSVCYLLPLGASFSGPNTWQSLGASAGLYGRCSITSDPKSRTVSAVHLAVYRRP